MIKRNGSNGKKLPGKVGNKKGVKLNKPTAQEMTNRLQVVMNLLTDGRADWEICEIVRNAYKRPDGSRMCKRSSQNYISRARDELCKEHDISDVEMRAQLAAIIRRDMNNVEATIRDRQSGVKILMSMYGLKAPQKIALTDIAGNDIHREALEGLTIEELKVLAKAQDRMEALSQATVEGTVISRSET